MRFQCGPEVLASPAGQSARNPFIIVSKWPLLGSTFRATVAPRGKSPDRTKRKREPPTESRAAPHTGTEPKTYQEKSIIFPIDGDAPLTNLFEKKLAIWAEKRNLLMSLESLLLPGPGESSGEPSFGDDLKPGGREQFGQNGALLGTDNQ